MIGEPHRTSFENDPTEDDAGLHVITDMIVSVQGFM